MICKECYEKKYGKYSELCYRLSKNKKTCYICGEKKRLLEKRFKSNNKKMYIIFD